MEGRRAFWGRLGDLQLLGKIFTAWSRALLHITVRRATALRELRLAKDFVTSVTSGERRRLRKEVERRLTEIDEELASNAPSEWLRLRAWVAWRMVLAQGLGKSGRRIVHGATRDSLCEQLLEHRRESSKTSCLGRVVRRRLVGVPHSETRRDRDRRERGSSCEWSSRLRDRARGWALA